MMSAEQEEEFRKAYDRMADIVNVASILEDYRQKLKEEPNSHMNKLAVTHYEKKFRLMLDEEEERQQEFEKQQKLKVA